MSTVDQFKKKKDGFNFSLGKAEGSISELKADQKKFPSRHKEGKKYK